MTAYPDHTQVSHKAHLEGLDGLRGIAAIAVVLHHLGSTLDLPWLAPRGYLAVDLFFVLSGYVLTYAYAARMHGTSVPQFMLRRSIRLYPLVVFGTIVGALFAVFRFRNAEPAVLDLILCTISGSLTLPVLMHTTLPFETFPINGPVWSLTFELIASFVFAFIAKRKRLIAFATSILLLSAITLGLIAVVHHNLSVGPLPTNWVGGFARVGFSFFAGVVIQKVRPSFVSAPIPMVWAICISCLFVPAFTHANGAFDLIAVLIVFPIAIAQLARTQVRGRMMRLCKISGEVSYPIYAIHYPVVLAGASIWSVHAGSAHTRIIVSILLTIILLIVSILVSRLFDIPVRRRLEQRYL